MMTVKNFDQKGAGLFGLPVSDKSGGLNLLGKGNGSIGNIGKGNGSGLGNGSGSGKGDDIALPGIAPSRDKRDVEDSAEDRGAGANDVYVFDPDDYSGYHDGYYDDQDYTGIDTLSLTGVGEHEVRVRRADGVRVYIEAYDNSFTLKVQLSSDNGIERVHFDQNGNGIEDGDDSILTKDELLTMAATEDMAIYVNHPDDSYSDYFYYHAGDGHQIIGDEDNNGYDYLYIYGWTPDNITLTRNADEPVRTYGDLQLEFPDGKTILLQNVLDGSNMGVDRIYFDSDGGDGGYGTVWTKNTIMRKARALVTQSSEDQFFHGFAEDDTYEYSRGDGHDTIFEDYHAGDDVLVLSGISRSDITVSYSDASDYGTYQPGTNDPTANPDLLLELGGRGTAATGSVLLALGAVGGFGVESVLFDENGNGIKDGNEISWYRDDMLSAAEVTAAADLLL